MYTQGSRGNAAGSNSAQHPVESRRAESERCGDLLERARHPDLRQCHRTVALGQPRPVPVEHQSDVCVRRLGMAHQAREIGLAR